MYRRPPTPLLLALCAWLAGLPGPAVGSAGPPDTPPPTAVAPPGMICVPAGGLVRGRDSAARPDERPRHEVQVSAFCLDATLVTRAAFARFVADTGYRTNADRRGYGMGAEEGMRDWEWVRIPGSSWRRPFRRDTPDSAAFLRDDAPVVMVSHDDAGAYCRYRGGRLPTEAEWEYAMRAGGAGRYPWGDDPARSGVGLGLNFWQGASHWHNERRDGHVYVSPVRAFPPNAWGFYDPAGNVWQWTADWYAPDTFARSAAARRPADPRGPESGDRRVLRGGSWWCGASTCEGNGLFYRGKSAPSASYNNIGFRCARDTTIQAPGHVRWPAVDRPFPPQPRRPVAVPGPHREQQLDPLVLAIPQRGRYTYGCGRWSDWRATASPGCCRGMGAQAASARRR